MFYYLEFGWINFFTNHTISIKLKIPKPLKIRLRALRSRPEQTDCLKNSMQFWSPTCFLWNIPKCLKYQKCPDLKLNTNIGSCVLMVETNLLQHIKCVSTSVAYFHFLVPSSRQYNVRESQLRVAQFVWVRPAVVTSSLIQPSALLCGVGRRERWRGWI